MRTGLVKPAVTSALLIALIGFMTARAGAQVVTLPFPGPTPSAGSTLSGLIINGIVDLDTIDLTVSTTTNNGTGITVNSGGDLLAEMLTVNVTGSSGVGVLVQNGEAGLTDTNILTTGTNGTGVKLGTNGNIWMQGGSVETQGTDGQAIHVFPSTSGQVQGTFVGATVKSDHGRGIFAQGNVNATVDFWDRASLTGGNGVLLDDRANGGFINLDGTNDVRFVGDIDATRAPADVHDVNVTLRQNSKLTGATNENSLAGAIEIASAEGFTTAADFTEFPGLPKQNVNLLVDETSTWNMTKSSTLDELEVFPGALIKFVGPNNGPFTTLAAKSLTGSGGIFAMNVDLGRAKGDLLVIQTTIAGFNEHHLRITNLDQGADLPPGTALLVVVTNQTSGLEFPSNLVDGGTYKYETERGNGRSGLDKHNWYLIRADEIHPPDTTPSPTAVPSQPPPIQTPTPLPGGGPNPTPIPSPTPTPSRTPLPPRPIPPGGEESIDWPAPLAPRDDLTNTANAAIGTYSATIPLFYADTQTLIERLGELRLGIPAAAPQQLPDEKGVLEPKQVLPPSAPRSTSGWAVWIRSFGSGMQIDNDVSRVFDQDIGGVQLGADKRLGALWNGDAYLGVFGSYIYGSRDFRDGGDGSTNAFSLGAYATWIHPRGWYADMVFKYTQMWNEFSTPTLENSIATGDYDIPAVGGSLEGGKRFDFAGGRFFIEPEAQLAGVWENETRYVASNGLHVHGDDQTSLRGHLGGRVGMHFDFSQRRAIEPYLRAEVIEEFLTGDTVTTNSTSFDSHLSGTTGRFGSGLTTRLGQSVYVYGEYDYLTGDHLEQPWQVSAGLRWQW
jgi:outer membrane autotransporter protein